jgi:hypothetical protein
MAVPVAVIIAVGESVKKLCGNIKGSTQHLSFNEVQPIADTLTNTIYKIIGDTYGNARQLIPDFSKDVAAAIEKSGWWKVGNDKWSGIPRDIRNNPDWGGTSSRLFIWAFGNAPGDNLKDAYYASKEILDKCLYPILNSHDPAISKAIDILIAGSAGLPLNAPAPTAAQTSALGGQTILTKSRDFFKSIFGGATSEPLTAPGSGATTTKTGFSMLVIVLFAGMALFVFYNLIKKGKPF